MPEKYQAAITAASALSLPCYVLLNHAAAKVCICQPVIRPPYRFRQLGITDFVLLGKFRYSLVFEYPHCVAIDLVMLGITPKTDKTASCLLRPAISPLMPSETPAVNLPVF